jgi:acyl-[acyl-carrier-protein]-phospholipid O-acyltransferase/long-chain-fatty-acid--[acyl-carrier-protein] ligase
MPRDYDPRAGDRGLFDALLDARDRFGAAKLILEDQERKPISYTDLVRAAFALGRKIAGFTDKGERVAIMLPSSAAVVVTFFALHAFGRTPAMLNFTAGIRNLKAACQVANIKTVLTSRRFIAQAKLQDLTDVLETTCDVVYLEDLRAKIGIADKAIAALSAAFARRFRHGAAPSDPGVVLFTSGSFGAPRGVMLSQGNLVANVEQVAAHIDLDPSWVMFNPLPTFHCLGLTGGALLPLLTGMKAFEYPSPLHVKQIPPLIRETGAVILMSTDTFVSQYARAAEPGDLSGLRFVVCGAERVRDETHDLVRERFGDVQLVEGYGATEASPVIAVNTPLDNRRGSVGALVPGLQYRLEHIEGIDEGGLLFVKGPNVMMGYLNELGELEPPPGGWHDTGDIVTVDDDGWLRIKGRVKRFAKIGGEMVSLSAAEALAATVWPDARHAVVALPDPKKGERLVLVTDRLDATVDGMLARAQATGTPELTVPRRIVRVGEIPLLGTGKTDYVAIRRMAEAEPRGG